MLLRRAGLRPGGHGNRFEDLHGFVIGPPSRETLTVLRVFHGIGVRVKLFRGTSLPLQCFQA